jgi:pantetheine-phosphate adenylyltransferase
MAYTVIGGTFNCLHAGHEAMLSRAFSIGGNVLVCLTSDAMAGKKHLAERIAPYAERKKRISSFLSSHGWGRRAEVVMISGPFDEGLRPTLTHIVASEETKKNAETLNTLRIDEGLPSLEIVVVAWVMAQDGRPVSGVRIRKGEIGKDGKPVPGVSKGKSPQTTGRKSPRRSS